MMNNEKIADFIWNKLAKASIPTASQTRLDVKVNNQRDNKMKGQPHMLNMFFELSILQEMHQDLPSIR